MNRINCINTPQLHSKFPYKYLFQSSVRIYSPWRRDSKRSYSNPLGVFKKEPWFKTALGPPSLPTDTPLEEELHPYYEPEKRLFPCPGDRILGQYEVISKLGFGGKSKVKLTDGICSSSSCAQISCIGNDGRLILSCKGSASTWLVRDLDRWHWLPEQYWAVKIHDAHTKPDDEEHEPSLKPIIEQVNQKSVEGLQRDASFSGGGLSHLPCMYMEIESPRGVHGCWFYEPMRETLHDYTNMFSEPENRLPVFLAKLYIKLLLMELRFLHDDCRIVHTDMKLKNIMLTFEDPSRIEEFVQRMLLHPTQSKVTSDGHRIFESVHVFPSLKSKEDLYKVLPKLADFQSADLQPPDAFGIMPIQAQHYRAPEVILGLLWSTPIDMWNFGVLLWNVVENKNLFDSMDISVDGYDPAVHLGYMYAILGKPPVSFVKRVDEWAAKGIKFPKPIRTFMTGKVYESPRELWGGPYFDNEGNFLRPELIPKDMSLADSVTSMEGKEKENFLRFARRMLCWDPKERAKAADLIDDPWLNDDVSD